MMSPRLNTIKLAIQHMRDRGKGMPIARMHMGERPLNPIEPEATGDFWILVNVLLIVVIDKLVPNRLPKDQKDERGEESTNNRYDDGFTTGSRRRLRYRAAF